MLSTTMYLLHGGGQQRPRRVIIHAMAEYINADKAAAARFAQRPGVYHAYHWLAISGLSAHSLITPSGANIRARRDNQTAYHARAHNTDTLGIEFLVQGPHDYGSFLTAIAGDYMNPAQYATGLDQVRQWLKLHTIEEVTTHSAVDPDRKKDPGAGFPINRFLQDLNL